MLRLQLLALQTGQRAQTHIDDRLCLNLRQTETLDQALLGDLRRLAASDDVDYLVDIILRDEQTL